MYSFCFWLKAVGLELREVHNPAPHSCFSVWQGSPCMCAELARLAQELSALQDGLLARFAPGDAETHAEAPCVFAKEAGGTEGKGTDTDTSS